MIWPSCAIGMDASSACRLTEGPVAGAGAGVGAGAGGTGGPNPKPPKNPGSKETPPRVRLETGTLLRPETGRTLVMPETGTLADLWKSPLNLVLTGGMISP